MPKNLFILLGFILATLACGKQTNSTSEEVAKTDTVLLVFQHDVDSLDLDSSQIPFSILGASALSTMTESRLPLFIDKIDTHDTLKLPTIDGYIEIALLYRDIQYIYMYLKGGDTVTFSYNKLGIPVAKSSISPALTNQYNFSTNIEGAFNALGFSPEVLFKLRKYKLDELYQLYVAYLDKYSQSLQTAAESEMLDSVYKDYYTYQYSMEQNKFISYFSNLQKQTFEIDEKKYQPQALNDTLARYISYYLSTLAFHTKGGYNFNQVAFDASLPPLSKKLILYYILRLWNIPSVIYKSPEQIEPFYNTFLSVTNDTIALEHLKKEFSYFSQLPEDAEHQSLILADSDARTTTLDSLLSEYKGKVIYVDFWASWCAPCKQAMPSAKQLREEYRNKDVVFLYLAFNDKLDSWKKAVKELEVDYLGLSYFIMNTKTSKYIEQLGVKTIPRYLLYNKRGNLIHQNAPNPEGKEIRALLDKALE